jgi:zinc transport system substrate-binding protein
MYKKGGKMKKSLKMIIILLVVAVAAVAGILLVGNKKAAGEKLKIVATNFPAYDFARAVAGDEAEVKMLLKPGAEMHDFEPTPQDVIDIKNSDLFVYVGGESDEWVADILKEIDVSKTKTLKMMDAVSVVEEEAVEGMEAEEEDEEAKGDEVEYDEHVWTSPKNAAKIVDAIAEKIADKSDRFKINAADYVAKLDELDAKFRDVVKNAKRKTIVIGDRFPLRYFVDEYNLKYFAAFPGCAEQTEASSKTISFLIDKVKTEEIPVVFKVELSSGKIADTIAKETGAKVVEFNAVHNVSAEDFAAGATYVSLMKKNVSALKEALL